MSVNFLIALSEGFFIKLYKLEKENKMLMKINVNVCKDSFTNPAKSIKH